MINQIIRYIVFRYNHHSPHSGYSRLAQFGATRYKSEIITVAKPLPSTVIRERILWRLARGTPGYNRSAMAAELRVVLSILKNKGDIYHFLYGETTYHYAGYMNNFNKNRMLATFHQPPSGIRQAVQINWHIKKLSAVVCVGSNQQEFFTDFFERERIFLIPLGVDTEFYTPPVSPESRDPNLCLCVGENYRDYPTLRGVIELVSYLRPKTRFVMVISPGSYGLIGSHPNLVLRSGVPESELLELYRSASLMVMPLHDATANNAILESMACGLPLVVSDVGAIRDYVNPEAAELIYPHGARRMAETIVELLEEPGQRQKMSEVARRQALKFAWPDIIKQLDTVYQSVV
jgi:glycosyltransferase involved in cell wall biosynthesis